MRRGGAEKGDTSRLEGVQNRKVELTSHPVGLPRAGDEDMTDEIDRSTCCKGVDVDAWLGVIQHICDAFGDADDQLGGAASVTGLATEICSWMRPGGSPRVLFCTCFVIRSELGTMTVVRSKVWISLAHTRMRRISPSTPSTLTQSSTLTGRSISKITPETKF